MTMPAATAEVPRDFSTGCPGDGACRARGAAAGLEDPAPQRLRTGPHPDPGKDRRPKRPVPRGTTLLMGPLRLVGETPAHRPCPVPGRPVTRRAPDHLQRGRRHPRSRRRRRVHTSGPSRWLGQPRGARVAAAATSRGTLCPITTGQRRPLSHRSTPGAPSGSTWNSRLRPLASPRTGHRSAPTIPCAPPAPESGASWCST